MPRGAGGRNKRPMSRDEQVSRVLSRLLRHSASSEGLKVLAGGWIPLEQVLNNRNVKPLKLTISELIELVAGSDKQRFALKAVSDDTPNTPVADSIADSTANPAPSSNPPQQLESIDPNGPSSDYLIRATQGHTLKFDLEDLLQPVTLANVPPLVVHGTNLGAWRLILSSGGLKSMGRNHVHFAMGLPRGFAELSSSEGAGARAAEDGGAAAPAVISGMRTSSTVLIYLDLEKALEAGMTFGRSENGVVLTEGNGERIVPVAFFRKVEDRKNRVVLMEDGVLVGKTGETA